MTGFSFSAPGKLYLLGEYAVLEGAPALLTAVDRRATVTLTDAAPADDSGRGWSLTAPEIGLQRLALGPAATLPERLDGNARRQLALFDEVRRAVDALAPAAGAFDIRIDSAQFHRGGHKLGLGSSAAVAVALTAAFAASRGVALSPAALFELAAGAHAASQQGKGSGGDIAASVYGGTILYRRGSEPHRVSWPQDLSLFAVTTGTGSSTTTLVSHVARFAERKPAAYRRELDRLATVARRTEAALGSADAFLALADEYFRGIITFDTHARAGIVTDRHRELRKIAASSGAVFKTSGAGGGDVGLIFAKLDSTDRLESVFTEAGATVISVPRSHDGVRMETT